MQKETSSGIGLATNGVHENGHGDLPGGVNIEANIVASENKSVHDDSLNWVAESLKFSVKQPVSEAELIALCFRPFRKGLSVVLTILPMLFFVVQVEAIVTKDELQHLTFLCKSEVDAMGRIVAGVLRVLKLEESVGQAALNQLSNLGMSQTPLLLLKIIVSIFSSS